MANRVVDFPAPLGGVEWRAGAQKENNAQVLVNADLSRGILQARRGFKGVSATEMRLARVHQSKASTDKSYVIAVGSNSQSNNDVLFKAFDEWGNAVGSTQNLTQLFGEPEQEIVLCSFVDHIIKDKALKDHLVTLITTKHNTYLYEPWKNNAVVRLADTDKLVFNDATSGDAKRQYDNISSYLVTGPKGYIATEHNGSIIYAGFEDEAQFWLSETAESDQDAIKSLTGDNQAIVLGPQFFLFTDLNDPVGIQAWATGAVSMSDKITGLRSYQENLIIFSANAIHALVGPFGIQTFTIVKIASGAGCVAHNSIVEANGILYFMGHDGIYAFGGLSAPQAVKISTPVDALWSGRHDAGWVPEAVNSTLYEEMHWPWTVSHEHLQYSNVVHYKELNQIWWSVPVKSKDPFTFPVTLVFDYANNAWSFHYMSERSGSGGSRLSCMFDGVSVRGKGSERVYTTQARGELQQYGWYRDEASSTYSNDGAGIPLVWVSNPLGDEGANNDRLKDVRFHILSTGKKPSTNPPKCFISGQEAHYDMQQTAREEKSQSLDLHPNESLAEFFFGDAKFNDSDSFFTEADWFLSKLNARVRSPAWRVGIIDDAKTQDRPPLVHMKKFSAEVKRLGTE